LDALIKNPLRGALYIKISRNYEGEKHFRKTVYQFACYARDGVYAETCREQVQRFARDSVYVASKLGRRGE